MLWLTEVLVPLAAASPSASPTGDVDPILVTPGPMGFIVVGLIAAAAALLVWDMLRRIRRGNYRAELAEELDAELADREGDDRPGGTKE